MPQIERVMVISTTHIKRETGDWLDRSKVYASEHEYGWFVWVDEDVVKNNGEDGSGEEWPADLVACLRHAHENECTWLNLDRDGNIGDLPKYDW
jgi:hypothetical protein